MLKPIIAAAALSVMVSSAVWAAPATTVPNGGVSSPDLLLVGKGDHDKHWYGKKNGWRGGHAFDDDDYRGRKRYSYRPYDWEDVSTSAPSGTARR
jgi:hypothetical protein